MEGNDQVRVAEILAELSTKSNRAVAFQYEGHTIKNIVGVAYFNVNFQNYHYISYN